MKAHWSHQYLTFQDFFTVKCDICEQIFTTTLNIIRFKKHIQNMHKLDYVHEGFDERFR